MDKSTAIALIEKQRRRWGSQASDEVVARRAERVFRGLAAAWLCIGVSLSAVQHTTMFRILHAATFLFGAVIFYWQSRRFAQVRKLLSSSDAKTDTRDAA
jgi:hypothetical protein